MLAMYKFVFGPMAPATRFAEARRNERPLAKDPMLAQNTKPRMGDDLGHQKTVVLYRSRNQK